MATPTHSRDGTQPATAFRLVHALLLTFAVMALPISAIPTDARLLLALGISAVCLVFGLYVRDAGTLARFGAALRYGCFATVAVNAGAFGSTVTDLVHAVLGFEAATPADDVVADAALTFPIVAAFAILTGRTFLLVPPAIRSVLTRAALQEQLGLASRHQGLVTLGYSRSVSAATQAMKWSAVCNLLLLLGHIVGALILSLHRGTAPNSLNVAAAAMCCAMLSLAPILITARSAQRASPAASLDTPAEHVRLRLRIARCGLGLSLCGATLGLLDVISLPHAVVVAALGLTFMGGRQASVSRDRCADGRFPRAAPRSGSPSDTRRLLLEAHPRLLSAGGETQDPVLAREIEGIRSRLSTELGFRLPPVELEQRDDLPPGGYQLSYRGQEFGRGDLKPDSLLALRIDRSTGSLDAHTIADPVFGMPAHWIPRKLQDDAQAMGYAVVPPLRVMAMHVEQMLLLNSFLVLEEQDVRDLLDEALQWRGNSAKDRVIRYDLNELGRLLRMLLEERISLREFKPVVDVVDRHCDIRSCAEELLPLVRGAISRQIVDEVFATAREARVVMVDPQLAMRLGRSIPSASAVDRDWQFMQHSFVREAAAALDGLDALGEPPVIVTTPSERLALSRLIRDARPRTVVLAFDEVNPHLRAIAWRTLVLDQAACRVVSVRSDGPSNARN